MKPVFALAFALVAAAAAFAQQPPAESLVPPRPAPESELIAVLQSDADWATKQAACRGLRQTGTAASVPALAALLGDPELSHMARYALESMPAPEASDALRAALTATGGSVRGGIANSLGVRRDTKAIGALEDLIGDADADVARAAIGALGRIGTGESAKTLLDAKAAAPAALHDALGEAVLAAAEQLLEDGHAQKAAKLYRTLSEEGWALHVRMGAFRGMVMADPGDAPRRILDNLGWDDPIFRELAGELVAETAGAESTAKYAAALPGLESEGKAALIRGLARRADPGAREAVVAELQSGDAAVKLAAVRAMATLGTAAEAPALAALLTGSDEALAAAATTSLIDTRAAGVDDALAALLPGADAAGRAKVIEMLQGRVAPQAVPVALAHLGDADAGVRVAALKLLSQLATMGEAGAVIGALRTAADSGERNAAADAVGSLCKVNGEQMLAPVREAMNGAAPEVRGVLVRALGRIATPAALETVVAMANDKADTARGDAVRTLAGWATQDAAPHLEAMARKTGDEARDNALRGYIRLARENGDGTAKAAMLDTAMKLATTQGEKWAVLSAYATLVSPAALDALKPHLADAAVRNEAAAAIVTVAAELAKADANQKPAAIAALDAALAAGLNDDLRARAQAERDKLAANG